VLDANLPQPLAPTLYSRAGDGVAGLLVGVAFVIVMRARRRRTSQ
jgi:apolipoprotein N-acyltransferase